MTRRLLNALRLFLRVQARSFFPHIYLALAVLTVAGFRLLLPEGWGPWLLPAFLLGEPGLLGLTLVAAQRYLEKNQRNESALCVTPLRGGEYVAALVLASALQACAAGALIQAGVVGLDARVGLLLPPLFLIAALSGLVGLALSTYASEFTRFLVFGLIPAMALAQLPILSYLGLVPRELFVWTPSDPALFAFALLSAHEFEAGRYLLHLAQLGAFTALAFAWALHCFQTRIRQRLEQT